MHVIFFVGHGSCYMGSIFQAKIYPLGCIKGIKNREITTVVG